MQPARTFDGEVERIRLAAVARLADGHLGMHAEVGARVALVGIARPGFSVVLQIDADRYDGMQLWRLFEESAGKPVHAATCVP